MARVHGGAAVMTAWSDDCVLCCESYVVAGPDALSGGRWGRRGGEALVLCARQAALLDGVLVRLGCGGGGGWHAGGGMILRT